MTQHRSGIDVTNTDTNHLQSLAESQKSERESPLKPVNSDLSDFQISPKEKSTYTHSSNAYLQRKGGMPTQKARRLPQIANGLSFASYENAEAKKLQQAPRTLFAKYLRRRVPATKQPFQVNLAKIGTFDRVRLSGS